MTGASTGSKSRSFLSSFSGKVVSVAFRFSIVSSAFVLFTYASGRSSNKKHVGFHGAPVASSTVMTKDIVKLAAVAAGALILKSTLNHFFEFDLNGKTVLITGGSRGLGLVMAREFAREGARVALCARDEAELERAQADLETLTAEVMTVPCDVTNRQSVALMIDHVDSRFRGVDVLVNNAGVIQVGPIEVMTPEDFDEAMKVHFWGPLNTVLAVLPAMRARKSGRIVNISSIAGKVSVPHLVPYSASKFALVGLSKGLRTELMKDGIKVTTVCPGLMRTGSPRNADFKG